MTKNEKFKVLIVDDEPEALELLKALLTDNKNVEVVVTASNAEEAMYLMIEHYPNLMLLDINLPGKNGMDLIEIIRKRNVDIPVVFISAYSEYALRSIRNQVYDFLLKPVSPKELNDIIEKYCRLNKKDLPGKLMSVLNSIKEDSKIRINSRYSYVLVDPAEIVYCEAEDGYTIIHLTNGKTEVANSALSLIEAMVYNRNFFRLGRSLLINMEYVRNINKSDDNCTLKFGENLWKVKASHTAIKELLTHFPYV